MFASPEVGFHRAHIGFIAHWVIARKSLTLFAVFSKTLYEKNLSRKKFAFRFYF